MPTLKEIIAESWQKGIAVGHFNISELAALKAIVAAARETNSPVLVGTSEGERDFIGVKQTVALVASLREQYNLPIFLNADHTHSLAKIKEAVLAGYDAVLFDGSKLSWEENVRQTKEVVEYVKATNPDTLVEGEIGYIGSSSEVIKELPAGAAVRPEDLTTPEQAAEFVKATGVDLLAPAVGNIHGIVVAEGVREKLDIERIQAIRSAVQIPMVLHGGSGNTDEDFRGAVLAGMAVVHISTSLRVAWREGLEAALQSRPEEIAPYKLFPEAIEKMQQITKHYILLFQNKT